MSSRRWRDVVIPGRPVQIAGGVLVAIGLALPLPQLVPKAGEAAISRGEARPAMRVVPAGSFLMGSPETESGRDQGERLHRVDVTVPFAISVTEITQGQYERVMGVTSSKPVGVGSPRPTLTLSPGDQLPVALVSWIDTVLYCNRLSEIDKLEPCYVVRGTEVTWPKGLACTGYRLPTEAEWEYAARASSPFVYAGSNAPAEVAVHVASGSSRQPVGRLKSNAWGLYDTSGNVLEWVWDWHGDYPPAGAAAQKDPIGPASGSDRVYRGGSYGSQPEGLRVAKRFWIVPSEVGADLGFRIARSFPGSY